MDLESPAIGFQHKLLFFMQSPWQTEEFLTAVQEAKELFIGKCDFNF
jgi:hypothetical protein